jgi:hypothetical protein|tara:strand:+ start:262 stop:429 length:168 start_codon:yes stop_codon:yes gene_type:complete
LVVVLGRRRGELLVRRRRRRELLLLSWPLLVPGLLRVALLLLRWLRRLPLRWRLL